MIDEPSSIYFSTRDYKRLNGKFSVKSIRKELKKKAGGGRKCLGKESAIRKRIPSKRG